MILLLALAGCTPTCDDVCNKLVTCGNPGTEMLDVDDCSAECQKQQDLYDHWTDTELRASFDDSLHCYMSTACDQIASGACYDAEIWDYTTTQ